MTYLLVNHIPFARGHNSASFLADELFLLDLRAQAAAISQVGGRLIVAAPLVESLESHARTLREIAPDDHGFEFFPLPYFRTYRDYRKLREVTASRLAEIVPHADVVQMDYGGHPVMLGQVVWPVAGLYEKKTIWVFDEIDPFPRYEADVSNTRGFLKRTAKRWHVRKKEQFCRNAVRQADLVFAHTRDVMDRFSDVWDPARCFVFDRFPLGDEHTLSPAELSAEVRRLGTPGEPLRLLCLAGDDRSAAESAVRAFAHCHRLSVTMRLTVAVAGSHRSAVEEMAGGLAVSEFIHFRGVPSAGDAASAAAEEHDLILLPGAFADLPVVLNALARGRAVLATLAPATELFLESSEAAIFVPAHNILLLAQVLIDLDRDRTRLAELATSAVRFARKKTLQSVHRERAELAAALLTADQPQGGNVGLGVA